MLVPFAIYLTRQQGRRAETPYPGVTERILTNPVDGLDNYQEMMRLLVEDKEGAESVCECGVKL